MLGQTSRQTELNDQDPKATSYPHSATHTQCSVLLGCLYLFKCITVQFEPFCCPMSCNQSDTWHPCMQRRGRRHKATTAVLPSFLTEISQSPPAEGRCACHVRSRECLAEVVKSLKLGNVWVFVQLIFGPRCPMNQLNRNPNIA